MIDNLKLQEAIEIVKRIDIFEFNNPLKIVISAAQSIIDKGEAKQMTVTQIEKIICRNYHEPDAVRNLATALYEAVYGGK